MNENLLSTGKLLNRSLLRACSIRKKMSVLLRDYALTGLAAFALSVPAVAGTVGKDVPDTIDSSAKYYRTPY